MTALKTDINKPLSRSSFSELARSDQNHMQLSTDMITEDEIITYNDTSYIHSRSCHDLFIRCIDILGAGFGLIIFLPLFTIVLLAIKLTSPGPIIYRQKRVGKNGRLFEIYKFRSMKSNAEDVSGPVLARMNDSRVTPLGRVLRKTRVDELPQLANVLLGDMSLVGPRPERPFFVERNEALQGLRLSVKPGITGLAQIRGLYDLKLEHKSRYDSLYIKNRTALLNVSIHAKTIPVLIKMKGW
jgi:lipopolysaccharide/colanic/teichoic acid biosynthesis glycosyltransferase